MLRSLRLRDFKSFADETVELAPLTLLVGANGSGKSNFLDAIRFLHGVGLDLPIADILRGRWEGGNEVWQGIRGGAKEAARGGAREFELSTVWAEEVVDRETSRTSSQPRGGRRNKDASISHEIKCRLEPTPAVIAEKLVKSNTGKYLFDTHAKTLGSQTGISRGGGINVALKRDSGGGRGVSREHPAQRSLLGQIEMAEEIHDEVGRVRDWLVEALSEIFFLDIAPRRMRDYAPRQIDHLGLQGENISALVWQLARDEERKQDLVDWLSELCAPQLKDIDFVETELGDVLLVLVEEDGTRISARSASDGTLRFLGELTALLTAPEGSMVLIEEVENGLHPTRLHLLVELLEMVTRERGIQVIATTHSPITLEALGPEILNHAVVFGRPPDHDGTVVRRLGDLPQFDEIAERRGVDRLFTTGWMERALWMEREP